jgi:hypothetical protein
VGGLLSLSGADRQRLGEAAECGARWHRSAQKRLRYESDHCSESAYSAGGLELGFVVAQRGVAVGEGADVDVGAGRAGAYYAEGPRPREA